MESLMMDGCGGALTTLVDGQVCVQLSIGTTTNVVCIIALRFHSGLDLATWQWMGSR